MYWILRDPEIWNKTGESVLVLPDKETWETALRQSTTK